MNNEPKNDQMKVTMDDTMKGAFEGIKTYIDSVKTIIKNNYTNLKDDIERVDKGVSELKVSWQKDHDRIIRVEQELLQQSKDFMTFKEQEQNYGKSTDLKINTMSIETKLEIKDIKETISGINLSVGKIIGIAAGSSFVMGIFLAIVFKLLEKLFI